MTHELNDIAEPTSTPSFSLFGTAASSAEDDIALPGQAEEQIGRMLAFSGALYPAPAQIFPVGTACIFTLSPDQLFAGVVN